MPTNTTVDPWVAYLLEDGTTQSLLMSVALCIRSLWATLGIVFNAAIVYVTVANKSLHGICNILIATESLLALLMDAGFHVSTVVFVSGIKFITFRTCFPIIFCVNNLPSNTAQITMLLTGLDRLLCIVFPIWYKNRKRWHCFFFIGTVQALYGIFSIIFYSIDFGKSDQTTLVTCSSHDKLQGGMAAVTKFISLTLSGMLMTMYSLIFLFAFVLRPIAKNINGKNRRLIKSLVFIIGMQMFGVFFRQFMTLMLATYWKVDVFINMPYAIAVSFVTIAGANAPVLYVFSEEYRKIFNKHFPYLPTMLTRLNAPRHQTVVIINNSTLVNNFTAGQQ